MIEIRFVANHELQLEVASSNKIKNKRSKYYSVLLKRQIVKRVYLKARYLYVHI